MLPRTHTRATRARNIAVAVTGVLVLSPAAAHAATVEVSGAQIQFAALPGETNLISVTSGGDSYVVTDSGVAPVTAGSGCTQITSRSARCLVPGLDSVRATLGDGDDSFDASALTVNVAVYGEEGNDTITSSESASPDILSSILDGGAGNDTLRPGSGIGDRLAGGSGVDTADYSSRTAPVVLDNNGGYSSGGVGEYDRIASDVEQLVGGSGNDTLRGGDGDDILRGGAGDDRLDGGAGADTLDGGIGNDRLDGGTGEDVLLGGAGDDALVSRDSGTADSADCGDGADAVTADRSDNLSGCESVDVPALADPVVVDRDVPVDREVVVERERIVQTFTPVPAGAPAVVTITQRELVFGPVQNVVSVRLTCGAENRRGCSGEVVITTNVTTVSSLRARTSATRKTKPVVLARTRFNLKAGETRMVSAKISRRGVKQAFGGKNQADARARGKRRIKAVMSVSTKGSDGSTTRITKPITVRLPASTRSAPGPRTMQIDLRLRRRLLPLWVAAGVALLILMAHNAAGLGAALPDRLFSDWIHVGLIVLAAAACAARCALLRLERAAWALFALALALWAAGELYHSFFLADLEVTPFPSLGDFFYVGFYPVAFAALVSVVRARVRALGGALLLDGLVAALAACSVAAAFLFESVLLTLAGEADISTIVFNLAYPIGDLVLLGAVAGAFSLTGWRPGRTLAALGAGMFFVAFADGLFLVQSVKGTYVEGAWLDALWPAGLLLIGWASFQPAKPVALRLGGWRIMALPIVLSLAAVVVLVAGQVGAVNAVALALATAAVVAVIVRMVWTLRENTILLESTRAEALTDALTGLANRRSLSLDLERTLAMAGPETPWVLVLFDLDGFKDYNDTFGHPAGDALLSRRGRDLKAAVKGHGSAYRPGGDEFTVLVNASEAGAEAIIAACVGALSEKGDNYRIRPSWGAAVLPTEADDVTEALRIADQRMYARKGGRRSSAKQQSIDVLISVLHERQVELHTHSTGVAELAVRAGTRLGMGLDDLEEMAFAAELHDIGKLAVSEQLLNKPAPLSEAEWAEMHEHTVIGERILRAAPTLQPVARIVRASHERWDGSGYPDKVAGQQIPLGARVVAVCDAYDAMTSDRPYRRSIGQERAMEELQRCAGSQFDPEVVEVVCDLLANNDFERPVNVASVPNLLPEPAVA